jgi:hypothetical protein
MLEMAFPGMGNRCRYAEVVIPPTPREDGRWFVISPHWLFLAHGVDLYSNIDFGELA